MRHLLSLALLACLAVSVVGYALDRQEWRERNSVLAQQLKDAKAEREKFQALYAEAKTEQRQRVDTVRVLRTRYDTLRQVLNVRDTVEVIAFVTVADSLAQACSELASSCERLRSAADSTIASLLDERWASNSYIEGLQRENAGLRKRKKLAWVGFVGGVAIGAWVRGQE